MVDFVFCKSFMCKTRWWQLKHLFFSYRETLAKNDPIWRHHIFFIHGLVQLNLQLEKHVQQPTRFFLGGGFTYVLFSSLFGEDEPVLTNIFQRGWNQQPDVIYSSLICG